VRREGRCSIRTCVVIDNMVDIWKGLYRHASFGLEYTQQVSDGEFCFVKIDVYARGKHGHHSKPS
jgi:hypothetical protein